MVNFFKKKNLMFLALVGAFTTSAIAVEQRQEEREHFVLSSSSFERITPTPQELCQDLKDYLEAILNKKVELPPLSEGITNDIFPRTLFNTLDDCFSDPSKLVILTDITKDPDVQFGSSFFMKNLPAIKILNDQLRLSIIKDKVRPIALAFLGCKAGVAEFYFILKLCNWFEEQKVNSQNPIIVDLYESQPSLVNILQKGANAINHGHPWFKINVIGQDTTNNWNNQERVYRYITGLNLMMHTPELKWESLLKNMEDHIESDGLICLTSERPLFQKSVSPDNYFFPKYTFTLRERSCENLAVTTVCYNQNHIPVVVPEVLHYPGKTITQPSHLDIKNIECFFDSVFIEDFILLAIDLKISYIGEKDGIRIKYIEKKDGKQEIKFKKMSNNELIEQIRSGEIQVILGRLLQTQEQFEKAIQLCNPNLQLNKIFFELWKKENIFVEETCVFLNPKPSGQQDL